jgi:hypothetical protein
MRFSELPDAHISIAYGIPPGHIARDRILSIIREYEEFDLELELPELHPTKALIWSIVRKNESYFRLIALMNQVREIKNEFGMVEDEYPPFPHVTIAYLHLGQHAEQKCIDWPSLQVRSQFESKMKRTYICTKFECDTISFNYDNLLIRGAIVAPAGTGKTTFMNKAKELDGYEDVDVVDIDDIYDDMFTQEQKDQLHAWRREEKWSNAREVQENAVRQWLCKLPSWKIARVVLLCHHQDDALHVGGSAWNSAIVLVPYEEQVARLFRRYKPGLVEMGVFNRATIQVRNLKDGWKLYDDFPSAMRYILSHPKSCFHDTTFDICLMKRPVPGRLPDPK